MYLEVMDRQTEEQTDRTEYSYIPLQLSLTRDKNSIRDAGNPPTWIKLEVLYRKNFNILGHRVNIKRRV